ncbi:hypothetical protein D9M71_464390 [compost metagenome]
MVQVLGYSGGILILLVVAATIQIQVLRPTEQILQTEQQQAILALAVGDPLGALARPTRLVGMTHAAARFLLDQMCRLRRLQPAFGIQPQWYWPGRPVGPREALDTAWVQQGPPNAILQRCFCTRQPIGLGTQGNVRFRQLPIARTQRWIFNKQAGRPALVVPPPVGNPVCTGRQQGQPAIEFAIQSGFRIHRQALRQA